MTHPTPPKPTPAHFTDPYEVGDAVAEVLTMRGYAAYFNGRYMSVIDASQSPNRLVIGEEWTSKVEDLSVRLLRGTANDPDMHPMARARAKETCSMLTSGDPGKVRYMRIVAAHARNRLPDTEEVNLPTPPSAPQEYNTAHHREARQYAEDEALDALTAARASGLIPAGRYAFSDLWAWWKEYRRTPDVTTYHPDAARVGRNRFYAALTRLEDTKVVTYSHHKYIHVN